MVDAPVRFVRAVRTAFAMTIVVTSVCVAATVVAPTPPAASAATITVGTIQAQMADHRGQNSGTGGNCIRYSPVGSTTSTTFVPSPGEAITAHGYSGSCPGTLNTSTQSAVGFRPSTQTTVDDGVPFLIGRMIHYNNPVTTSDQYFTGNLNIQLTTLGATTIAFPWTLNETPNTGGDVNDELAFNNQISNVTITQGGLTFKMVVNGFIPTANATACPTSPVGTPQNVFSTVERAQTHACLYATLVQVRSLTIVKATAGTAPPARNFAYTSSSTLAGSPWSNGSFSLANGGTRTAELTSGNTVTVTETDPADDRWVLTSLVCTEFDGNGTPQAVRNATINVSARQVTLNNIPAPLNAANPGITCTYTNTYTPRATLTLVKSVQSGSAAANLWTLTATGSAAPPPSGATISGPSGAAAVTAQRVPAGTYQLTETGTGAAATGYVQVGDWACRTAGGATLTVTNGAVTLPDAAASATMSNVTCTATNRLATGSLQIRKVVDDPSGGYTGGTSTTFSGTYDCGTGYTGAFTTLTTATPVTITGIPAGRTCTVTETTPTGGLLNASFAWGAPTFSALPVTITDQGTATVTITNHVVQRFGTFSVTKVIAGPGGTTAGYIGGTARVFPVTYSCTLTNGPTTSGTLNLTPAQAVSPASPIPAGSSCTLTETLTAEPGDFIDPSYAWTTPTIAPATFTIGAGTTATATITNNFVRRFSSLTIAKVVSGDGYLGGTAANFTVVYDCGPGFAGAVTLAAGGSQTVDGLPVGAACALQELPPSASLLSPAFTWGTATWAPGPLVTIVEGATATATVTNPTIAIFGRVSVTKAATGQVQGIASGTTFHVVVTCGTNTYPFDIAVGGSGVTPNVPVGTTCTVTETAPTGGLIDRSFAWGTAPTPQDVTITSSGQVVAVTVTNDVQRVRGPLQIAKAPIVLGSVVDPDRTYAIGYNCRYGSDDPVTGTVQVTAGGTPAVVPNLLLESRCTIVEDPATLAAPPSADESWVWLTPTVSPTGDVVVDSATVPATATVTNSIRQLTSGFHVSKVVSGEGKAGGYTPGATFGFTYDCGAAGAGTFSIADGQSFDHESVPVGTTCTVTETASRPTTPPEFGWDPTQISASTGTVTGSSVTFTIPDDPAGVQVNVDNPITPRFGSVQVIKQITGLTEGLLGTPNFTITLDCGAGRVFQLIVAANASATQGNIPAGSTCTLSETLPPGGLVDTSYAWGTPTFNPPTVTVAVGTPASVTVQNPIVRVTAPVRLVKTYTGAQGVIPADHTYPITWTCTYDGTTVGTGTVNVTADPDGVVLATGIPLESVCGATEGDLGAPSADPAFRWLPAVITGTTVTADGPNINTITVVNELVRDSGLVLVRKVVTGATEGYVNLGNPAAQDFTLHGSCSVPDHPDIPTRFADGSIADGGEATQVPIVASIGWTCSGYEDLPGQNLLRDTSYAWGPVVLDPPGTFTLTREQPTQIFLAENPIVRVRSSFSIVKAVVDPNGVVDPDATYTGGWSCQYSTDVPVTGTWSITPSVSAGFTVDGILLESVCTVTEDAPPSSALPDASWTWAPAQFSEPATVVAGGTARVTVTNTPERLWAGLQVTKVIVDTEPSGVLPGATFEGVWSCQQGNAEPISDRFTVAAGTTATLFTPGDQRVPATASCTVTEDTLATESLVDGSFGWGDPSYVPGDATVTLESGQTANVDIVNTVVRVYSAVTIEKLITGPAASLVPADRPFTGTITCQYEDDEPVTTTWSATTETPALRAGLLVESVCSVTEDSPGRGGQPVTDDPSFVWQTPSVSGAVTVTPPDETAAPIVVTNPTDRLFATFNVTKSLAGAVEGIADPDPRYVMSWSCVDGLGNPYAGTLEVVLAAAERVGPEEQIPAASECVINEPPGDMPALVDDAWQWALPTFTIDGLPAEGDGSSLSFVIPTPQEDQPEPHVEIGVTNTVTRTFGAYTLAKTSDPAPGSVVQPGSVVTYTVTVTSTGPVPVHDVVVTDDLTGVLANASIVDGSVSAPAGTSTTLDLPGRQLVWTVDDVAPGQVRVLTYQIRINPGAGGVTIANNVTGTGDVPPDCTTCDVVITTSLTPVVAKDVVGTPTRDPVSGAWTVAYRMVVTNPDAANAAPYDLVDTLGFAPGLVVRSATVTAAPPGVTLASPAWDGAGNTTIVTGASLPAGGAHTYDITVVVDVPPTTAATLLACSGTPAVAGSGLFNEARLTSLGTVSVDSACAALGPLLVVRKQWNIDGQTYAEGGQPAGFSAQLTLDGAAAPWGSVQTVSSGQIVQVGETVVVPDGCTSWPAGLGSHTMMSAVNDLTVTNTVTCQELPATGANGQPIALLAALATLLGGAALLVSRRRLRARR